ncbi:MAG: hypothetical protein MR928_10315, partial [Bacteroidales bacterium]|nr:hypothetical protein [Bacteroidales bacterium]
CYLWVKNSLATKIIVVTVRKNKNIKNSLGATWNVSHLACFQCADTLPFASRLAGGMSLRYDAILLSLIYPLSRH